MKNVLIVALAAVAGAACSDSGTQPVSPELDALLASAPSWTAADIARDLPVDDAERSEIEEKLAAFHASLVDLHERHEAMGRLEGEERDAQVAALEAEVESLHEQHQALWAGLDPAVTEALCASFHDRMRSQHEGVGTESLHERMRGLHGSGEKHGSGELHGSVH